MDNYSRLVAELTSCCCALAIARRDTQRVRMKAQLSMAMIIAVLVVDPLFRLGEPHPCF